MDLRPVPIAASGPLTFRCAKCGHRAFQANETVYADHAGVPFVDFYCQDCGVELLRNDPGDFMYRDKDPENE